MAISVATSGQNVTLGGTLAIQDNDWTINGKVRFPAATGTRVIFQNNQGPYTSFIRLRSSNGTPQVTFADDDGTTISFSPYTAYFSGNTNWRTAGLRRSGNTVGLWIDGAQVWDNTNASLDAIATLGTLYFGSNSGGGDGLGGEMAEWAMWNRALSTSEMVALHHGLVPRKIPTPYFYLPLSGVYQELIGSRTVTNNSTTIVQHPRMYY